MEESQHSDELFMFLASTAHDMKNSISVLSGTLECLLDAASPETEKAYPQMAQMLYQTRRLNDNLMQLLALYKRVGKPEYPFDVQPLEIGQLVEQVVALERVLLESRGIALELDVDPQLIWHFDEDLIVGVVSHAINNAVHYTRDRIRLAAREVDGMLEIRVEDNGAGFPKSLLDAGAPAHAAGAGGVNFLTNSAGLGLYFSGEVARMHRHRERHGTVALENGGALGGGCFVLRLP
ncbi:sensor histidine kinase [Massilia sp. DD77]|uniref:sensor histidine kinase n=1 Tax=Massilia sp. DD77 TaxID=3109349 RepID=UPI0030007620